MHNYLPARMMHLHLTEGDRYQSAPLYEAIVQKCRELKIEGATVFRGLEGYGDTAEIHRAHLLAQDLPIVIQIVDSDENIQRLLPAVENMMDQGLITISAVDIRRIQKALTADSR